MGGLARRAAVIRSMQAQKGNLLVLDSGNCLAGAGKNSRLDSEVLLQLMDRVGYDALNLGIFEFSHGLDFLAEWRTKVHFPFISSNLVLSQGTVPFAEQYVIKEVNGLKIGLLGVVSPELFDRVYSGRFSNSVQITSPQAALESLVPQLRNKVDVVILLASCEFDATKRMIQEIPGIDLAIVSGVEKTEKQWLEKPSGPAVVTLTYEGQELGLMEISLAGPSQIRQMQGKIIVLDTSISADETIQAVIDKTLGRPPTGAIASKNCPGNDSVQALKPIPEEGLKNLLKLKPEEYLEKLRKDPTQKGVNR